jgi:hypothetical protein
VAIPASVLPPTLRPVTGGLRIVSASVLALVALVPASAATGTPVPGAPACPITPADSFWHADVSKLPVHPQSATWVASIGTSSGLKADFGSGTWNGGPIGIPYTTVSGTQPRVPVSFTYADESDPGPYPIPANAPVEGGSGSTGDRHVLVVDREACRLWELYSAYPQNGGASWTAGSGATWDLHSNAMRALGWTSGDAAGLPILPGLVRFDEVAAGTIDHVIRFTAPRTANAYVWPASHKAATGGSADPPMGAWFRLKAGYDVSGFSAQNQVILRALKRYGMVLADNGSSWFTSGAPDPGWNNTDLNALKSVPGSAFEAVDVSSLKVSSTSYAVAGAPPRPPPPPPPPAPELVANPGFEPGLAGWAAGATRTVVKHACTAPHSGSCAAELSRFRSAGDAVLDDSPNTVGATEAGGRYAASAWVRAPSGRQITLRLRELTAGGALIRTSTATATGTGAWRQIVLTSSAANAGSALSLEAAVSLAKDATAQVDDISLKRA